MDKSTLLVILTGAGTALAWWPVEINPSLDLPAWLPLLIVALATVFSTLLSSGHWPRFLLASVVGTVSGLCSGWAIWPVSDGIAASYEGIGVAIATLAAAVVSLSIGFALRRFSWSHPKFRLTIWIFLCCSLMLAPITLALTPPLVTQRMARNDRLATLRFEALKRAVEETRSEAGNPSRICDGTLLKSHYHGPIFSEGDWRFITGNAVKEDHYFFSIHCPDDAGRFTIEARPERDLGDGTRQLCTDKSGVVGCRVEWRRSGIECVPCAK
jgi:hypothetical protein